MFLWQWMVSLSIWTQKLLTLMLLLLHTPTKLPTELCYLLGPLALQDPTRWLSLTNLFWFYFSVMMFCRCESPVVWGKEEGRVRMSGLSLQGSQDWWPCFTFNQTGVRTVESWVNISDRVGTVLSSHSPFQNPNFMFFLPLSVSKTKQNKKLSTPNNKNKTHKIKSKQTKRQASKI